MAKKKAKDVLAEQIKKMAQEKAVREAAARADAEAAAAAAQPSSEPTSPSSSKAETGGGPSSGPSSPASEKVKAKRVGEESEPQAADLIHELFNLAEEACKEHLGVEGLWKASPRLQKTIDKAGRYIDKKAGDWMPSVDIECLPLVALTFAVGANGYATYRVAKEVRLQREQAAGAAVPVVKPAPQEVKPGGSQTQDNDGGGNAGVREVPVGQEALPQPG